MIELEEKIGPEFYETLTGVEEIAIQKAFGADFTALAPMTAARALVFVALRRTGVNDKVAVAQVMDAQFGEINACAKQSDNDIEGKE